MQKVLHIIPRLGNGGAEKLLLSTAPHYLKHNLKIKIICLTSESQICDELWSRSIDVLCMHGKGRMYDLLTVKNLLKTIKTEKPDIVISHLPMANFFACSQFVCTTFVFIVSQMVQICKIFVLQ